MKKAKTTTAERGSEAYKEAQSLCNQIRQMFKNQNINFDLASAACSVVLVEALVACGLSKEDCLEMFSEQLDCSYESALKRIFGEQYPHG